MAFVQNVHYPYQTIGEEFDATATYQEKADNHAIKTTKDFLEPRLDRAASTMLMIHFQSYNSLDFYRSFFHKHAIVFARERGSWIEFDCRNVSACTVALIRELS